MEIGLTELDALVLSHVGLPRDVGALFTTDLTGPPGIFSVQRFENPDGQVNAALFIGAPGSNLGMRYFLDAREGFVVLSSLDESDPQAEVVNTSLSDFAEFIHRLGARYRSEGGSRDEEIAEAAQLEARLREQDPFAFRRPDTWWSMALEKIKEHAEGQE